MEIVRSAWELEVERHLRDKYPDLNMVTNDRTIIPSRDSRQKLELDFFFPEISLAIELNGERFHDKSQYFADIRNGTEISDEMYKENYCFKKGIRLVHVWYSSYDQSQSIIDSEIDARLNDPYVEPYKRGFSRVVRSGKVFNAIVCVVMVTVGLVAAFFGMRNGHLIEGLAIACFMVWVGVRMYNDLW